MARIAVITTPDTIWSLSCWTRTIPALKSAGHDIAGVWTCDDRLVHMKDDAEIFNWYRHTFGFWNFTKLAFFGILTRLCQLLSCKPLYMKQLLRRHGVFHAHTVSPNSKAFVDWVREQGIDVLVIMAPQIIKPPLIKAVRIGIINKHAALLPSNRGLFPYFWAKLNGGPQAVSFHQVTEEIDAGRILYQKEVTDVAVLSSMTAFYADAFTRYPEGLLVAIDALVSGREVPPVRQVAESYYSLPSHADYLEFRRAGGYVVRLKDLLLAKRLAG